MPFLALPALLGLLFLPVVVAMYMLRLRRQSRTVSSTYLWQALVRDVEANAPWQRLRRSWLLLLQLLLVAAFAFLAARPFSERPAGLARDLVVVLDASASMASTDVHPDRLTAAKRALVDALKDVPADGRISVVAAGETARVVANEVTDKGRATAAIERVRQTNAIGDLREALRLAGALAARARGAEILVATDDAPGDVAAVASPSPAASPGPSATPGATSGHGASPGLAIAAPIRVLPVGRERNNQAIVALAVQADPSGVKRSVFVSVANLADERVTRRLQILADGVPVTARDLALDRLRRTEVLIDEIPERARVVEARLGTATTMEGGTGVEAADVLALDDRAWAIVPQTRLQRILLVGPGNVYLQNALALLPNVELYGATVAEYPDPGIHPEKFDLIVFDGWLPAELPAKPILAIAPPSTSPLGQVTGTLTAPRIGEPASDEPLLRNVDLTRLHVARAQKMVLPAWARTVIPGPSDSPLLYAGLRSGLPSGVLAFDLRQSDLPLQVAWPILAANLVGELLGLDPRSTEPVLPNAPLDLPLPADAAGFRVTKPDGSAVELLPSATGASVVTFVGTDQLGVYRVEPIPSEVPSGSPGASPTPTVPASPSGSPTASGSPDPSASPGPGEEEPPGTAMFAVDLFALSESDIRPGDGSRLARLGTSGDGGAAPGAGVARDEWWVPLALLALALLLLEWLVYERDGLRRLVGRLRGTGAPRPRFALRRRA